MGKLMIRCPNTGKPLFTGIAIDRATFENPTNVFRNNTVGPCPHCGQMHTWSKEDAFVSDD
jgi:hypothetical protein